MIALFIALAATFGAQPAVATTKAGKVLIVVGMTKEADIAAGPGTMIIKGGGGMAGDAAALRAKLAKLDVSQLRAVISMGIAGGLSPDLKSGDLTIPSEIVFGKESFPTDTNITMALHDLLNLTNKGPSVGLLTGEEALAAITPAEKAKLRAQTGADIVDNESHIAAEFASQNNLPFAALRVIDDAYNESLPPAALVGMTPDGDVDYWSVLKSVATDPSQIPELVQEGYRTENALNALSAARCVLDSDTLAGISKTASNSAAAIWKRVQKAGAAVVTFSDGTIERLVSSQEYCDRDESTSPFYRGACFVGYTCNTND